MPSDSGRNAKSTTVGTESPRVALVLAQYREVLERAARWIESEADANAFGEDLPEGWQLAVSVIRDQIAMAERRKIEAAAFCEMQDAASREHASTWPAVWRGEP